MYLRIMSFNLIQSVTKYGTNRQNTLRTNALWSDVWMTPSRSIHKLKEIRTEKESIRELPHIQHRKLSSIPLP